MSETTTRTVEEVVRKQLGDALGGGRGMLEAAVPTIAFTVLFLTLHDLRLAIMVSVGCAGVLLLVRLVQRSSPQFVLNALLGIGIGALFAWRAARGGTCCRAAGRDRRVLRSPRCRGCRCTDTPARG